MPFESDKQRKFLYSQKPEVAKKFAEHEPAMKRKLESLKDKKHGTNT